MTVDELRKTEAAYRAASRRSEQAREARNAAVLAAIDEGWSHAQVAQVTGLTRSRVGQIALTREPAGGS